MSKNRAKGTTWQSTIVDCPPTHGAPHAERRALGGAKDRGDIVVVWMAVARKGAAYHTLTGDRRTPCGRFYGGTENAPAHGVVLDEVEALSTGAVQCKRCFGLSEVHAPPVVRTGRP